MSGMSYDLGDDGVVTLTMDMPGNVNAMGANFRDALDEAIARLEAQKELKGVILTSAKSTFVAGGDLHELLDLTVARKDELLSNSARTKASFRRLEQLRVPVVAAINGAALGGGLELTLACNRRIVLDRPDVVVGLPEVNLGLLPGGGGIVRLVHLLGVKRALPIVLDGATFSPQQALASGIVDEVVGRLEDLVEAARSWILSHPSDFLQPWDRDGHQIPGGGALDPGIQQHLMMARLAVAKKHRGLLPAPGKIVEVAAEVSLLDFDTALQVETRGLLCLVLTPQAKNLITTTFFQLKDIKRGLSRPQGYEKFNCQKVGVIGAGMMGKGIAYACAIAGMNVVLQDVTAEKALQGKNHSQRLLQSAVEAGQITETHAGEVLGRITATALLAEMADSNVIIETVFEDRELKNRVTQAAEKYVQAGGIFGSNTSTLPITLLSSASERPAEFIGIHFFSPVDRMALVEIICGKETSAATLAKTFDFVRQIGKIPIVVNDSLGFFTSRTFSTYLDEGARMVMEGVSPVRIENLARQIGMPVGPLAVQDEVAQELSLKASETHRKMGMLYSKTDTRGSTDICRIMIEKYGRGGRNRGGGFYEYPETGEKFIWPELAKIFKSDCGDDISDEDIKDRLLFRQVTESIKCLEEGVLRSVADGNVGSLFGIGTPRWTGGLLQFTNTYGVGAFAARIHVLAERYGDRFAAPALLMEKVAANAGFDH